MPLTPSALSAFVAQHQLPDTYLAFANAHFSPLLTWAQAAKSPQILGINGSQGSGKSTLAAWLVAALTDQGIPALALSMDDFYLGKAARTLLANRVHPLLGTRGVPGTHDVARAIEVLDALKECKTPIIPRFDKAIDDCVPASHLEPLHHPVKIIVLEGWCLGAQPQAEAALMHPINALERDEDQQGQWRSWVNRQLAQTYQAWFQRVDRWVMLRAPSFECVAQWRWQQEQKLWQKHKLAGMLQQTDHRGGSTTSGLMTREQVQRFVQYYERLTTHMLHEMPDRVEHLYQLDDRRNIIHEHHRSHGALR
ncbi:kinase-like protein [Simiduia agarivorans]|uniref:Kinase-like protein n=1 Tax=Simiduia agarivorans (strain DSM 21679 / JCM 13881 / BCRC 17597 / SA1) TaxID=1117647 RepID=K4KWD4_SIMAS|nr:kinase-like protein [Simiduia agarivorans]AFU98217.1 kinase-like protein [Simiduia agarivorans SA1 = DSM 21679]